MNSTFRSIKTITVLRGAAGSGKSSLANVISAQNGAVICEADEFMVNSEGEYSFNPNLLYKCHSQCLEKAQKAILNGQNVIYSNTNIRRKEFQKVVDFAREYGYKVQEIAILSSDFESIHNVPLDKVQEMKDNLLKSIQSE